MRWSCAKLDAPVKAKADEQDALKREVAFSHETLKESPEALRYLESRGLTNPEMSGPFQIGFASRTFGYRLPDKNRREGAELRGRLQKLGILRESGHEYFMGSVVFPVKDLEGSATEIYGRKVNDNLRAGTPMHTYSPGPHRGVWSAKRSSCANRSSRTERHKLIFNAGPHFPYRPAWDLEGSPTWKNYGELGRRGKLSTAHAGVRQELQRKLGERMEQTYAYLPPTAPGWPGPAVAFR